MSATNELLQEMAEAIAGKYHTPSEGTYDEARRILSALRSAGFAPPMHTGAIHKALQDAFQMGGIEAVQTLDRPDKFIQRKHRYSDAALNELLKAAQEDSRE